MNEYEKLYYEFYGFEFSYGSGHISKSKPMTWYRTKYLPKECGNGDEVPIFVKCRKCKEYMIFEKGWFKCSKCGARMKEQTALRQLDRENMEFEYETIWA